MLLSRLEIDAEDYHSIEETRDVSLLTSALKLFFRELPRPLIGPRVRSSILENLEKDGSMKKLQAITDAMRTEMSPNQYVVTLSLLKHLERIAREPSNMMTSYNLATVFGPNVFHYETESRRPESMMSELEHNNLILQSLINHASLLNK